jgi:hypothetical protein
MMEIDTFTFALHTSLCVFLEIFVRNASVIRIQGKTFITNDLSICSCIWAVIDSLEIPCKPHGLGLPNQLIVLPSIMLLGLVYNNNQDLVPHFLESAMGSQYKLGWALSTPAQKILLLLLYTFLYFGSLDMNGSPITLLKNN